MSELLSFVGYRVASDQVDSPSVNVIWLEGTKKCLSGTKTLAKKRHCPSCLPPHKFSGNYTCV